MPISVVRWMTFKEEEKYGTTSVPEVATFAVATIFSLSGFLNVMLVLATKPNLGLFGRHEPSARPPSRSAFDQPGLEAGSGVEIPMQVNPPQSGPSRQRTQ